MGSVNIEYQIRLGVGRVETFKFGLDSKSFDLIARRIPNPPEWAKLGYRQCSICPLNPQTTPYCPLALQLHDLVERFHDTRSIDEVELEVVTEERRVIQTLAIQQAIASMLDLIWPICGCPKTTNMKPLARFHLPVASEEETVFRVTGMYLLAQYFLSHVSEGAGIELDGLSKIYKEYHILNAAVASRLQEVTRSDSVKNAITLLDMYSMLVPALLDDQLAEMRPFFQAYLPEGWTQKVTTDHLKKAKEFRLELIPIEEPGLERDDDPSSFSRLELLLADEVPSLEAAAEKSLEDILNEVALKLDEPPELPGAKGGDKSLEDILSKVAFNLDLDEEKPAPAKEEPKVLNKAVFKLPDD